MPDFAIVDPHLHLWDQTRHQYPWLSSIPVLDRNFSMKDYDAACGETTVDTLVFVQCEVDRSQFMAEADWVASEAEKDPRIKGMVSWAPVEKGAAVAEDLEKLKQHDILRGVRQIIEFEPDPDFCIRSQVIEGIRELANFNLSFDICINYRQLPKVIEMVRQCPDIPMVLDHVGKPGVAKGDLHPWRAHFRELASCPNVFCKLSSLPTEGDHQNWTRAQIQPFIDAAVEDFGFDRLMYAGDWPVSSQAIDLDDWVSLLDDALSGTSRQDLQKFYRTNAIDFYKLETGQQ